MSIGELVIALELAALIYYCRGLFGELLRADKDASKRQWTQVDVLERLESLDELTLNDVRRLVRRLVRDAAEGRDGQQQHRRGDEFGSEQEVGHARQYRGRDG